jgi:hypothetical protein
VLEAFAYLSTGNAVFNGNATTAEIPFYLPTGNIVLSGSANNFISFAHLSNGNAVLSATTNAIPTYVYNAFGSIALSGEFGISSFIATGNAVLSNSFDVKPTYIYSAFGNVALGGSANVINVIIAIGGLVLSNSFDVKLTYLYTASGNAVLGNSAATNWNFTYSASGGCVFNNSSSNILVFTCLASGNIVLSNSANIQIKYVYLPTGNAVLGDLAEYDASNTHVSKGLARLGNSVDAYIKAFYTASGSAAFGGVAGSVTNVIGGNAVFGGTVSVQVFRVVPVTTANAVFGGSVDAGRWFWYESSGGAQFSSSDTIVGIYHISGYWDVRLPYYVARRDTCDPNSYTISKTAVEGLIQNSRLKATLDKADDWEVSCYNPIQGDVTIFIYKQGKRAVAVLNINKPFGLPYAIPTESPSLAENAKNQGRLEIDLPALREGKPVQIPIAPEVFTAPVPFEFPESNIKQYKVETVIGISQATLLAMLPSNHYLRNVSINEWTVSEFNSKNKTATVRMKNNFLSISVL